MLKRRPLWQREGEAILLDRFRQVHGRELNLAKPTSFSEKLAHRLVMLNRGNDAFTHLADKYLARDYVTEKIGAEHLVRLILARH